MDESPRDPGVDDRMSSGPETPDTPPAPVPPSGMPPVPSQPPSQPQPPPAQPQPPAGEWDAQSTRFQGPTQPPPQPPIGVPGQIVVGGGLYVPAGFWRRLGAFLIDAVILMIAHQIALAIIGYQGPSDEEMLQLLSRMFAEFTTSGALAEGTMAGLRELQRQGLFTGWLNVFICMAYFTVFHGMLGATLGKLCLGLRVLRRDGRALGYGWAWLRYLGYFILAKVIYTAWLIPFNAEQRTLYDIVLGTNVFRQLVPAPAPDSGRRVA